MTRNETTNERPTDYSKWHRALPDYCMAQDVDWVEYRSINEELIPVAIIETGRKDRTRFKDAQIIISKQIAKALDVPIFFVEYYIDEKDYKNNRFIVKKLDDTNKVITLNNHEYSEFIKGL